MSGIKYYIEDIINLYKFNLIVKLNWIKKNVNIITYQNVE